MSPPRRAARWRPLAAGLAMLVSTGPGFAAERLDAVLACRALASDAARLACFDRETAALASGPAPAAAAGTVAMAAPAAAKPAAAELSPEQRFGLDPGGIATREAERGQPPRDVDTIVAKITALRDGADGRHLFVLDNGQTWRQLQPGDDLLLKSGDAVKIARGAFSSYWLAAPSGHGCKVTRLR